MKVSDIVSYLESIANPSLQESYDNSGLLIGTGEEEINAVLISLDLTEEVLDEAIAKGVGMIISHHPIIFKGIKRFNAKNYVERIVHKAIKNDLVIYAIHTNLDNIKLGVNSAISAKLNLVNTRILAPREGQLSKLVTYVPMAAREELLEALFLAGAGNIGNYSEASFSSEGFGTFKGNEQSNPSLGEKGIREEVKESRLELLVNNFKLSQVLEALNRVHPYEEVAYEILPLSQANQDFGSGYIGELPEEMIFEDFMELLKTTFKLSIIRHTSKVKKKLKTIALCGGAGSFLLSSAIKQKADVFISADFKYHEFFDADNQIVIADIGHYESEQFTSQLLIDKLKEKFRNFAFLLTETNTNPVKYYK